MIITIFPNIPHLNIYSEKMRTDFSCISYFEPSNKNHEYRFPTKTPSIPIQLLK